MYVFVFVGLAIATAIGAPASYHKDIEPIFFDHDGMYEDTDGPYIYGHGGYGYNHKDYDPTPLHLHRGETSGFNPVIFEDDDYTPKSKKTRMTKSTDLNVFENDKKDKDISKSSSEYYYGISDEEYKSSGASEESDDENLYMMNYKHQDEKYVHVKPDVQEVSKKSKMMQGFGISSISKYPKVIKQSQDGYYDSGYESIEHEKYYKRQIKRDIHIAMEKETPREDNTSTESTDSEDKSIATGQKFKRQIEHKAIEPKENNRHKITETSKDENSSKKPKSVKQSQNEHDHDDEDESEDEDEGINHDFDVIDTKKNFHGLGKRDVRRQSQKVHFYGPNGINITGDSVAEVMPPVETSKMIEVKIEEQKGEVKGEDAEIKSVEATKGTESAKSEKIEVQKEIKPIIPKLAYDPSIHGPIYRHGYHHDQFRYYKRGHYYPGQDYIYNNDEFHQKLNNDKYIPLKYDHNKQEHERYTDFSQHNGHYKRNIVHAANVQDADLANISFRHAVQPINDNVDIDIRKNSHVLAKRDLQRQSQKVNFYGPNGINITGESVAEVMSPVETSKMVEVKIEETKGEEISLNKDAEIKLVEATKEMVSEKSEKIEVQKEVKPIIPKLAYYSSIYGPAYRHGYYHDNFRYYKRGHYNHGQDYKYNNAEFHQKLNNAKYIPLKNDHNKQEHERYTDFSPHNGNYKLNVVHAANVQDADLANILFRPTVQLINDNVDIDIKENVHVLSKRDVRRQSQKVNFYGPNGINITAESAAGVMPPVEASKMVEVKTEEPKEVDISLNKDAEIKLVEETKETVTKKSENIDNQKEVKTIIPKLAYNPSIHGTAYRHGYHHDDFGYFKRDNYNNGQDYKHNNAEFHHKLNNDKYIPLKYDHNKQEHERYTDFSNHNGNYKLNVVHAASVQDADLANISFRPTVQLINDNVDIDIKKNAHVLAKRDVRRQSQKVNFYGPNGINITGESVAEAMPPVETSKMVEVKIEEQGGEDISLNKDAEIKLVVATKETVGEKPEKIEVQKVVKVPKLVYDSSIYGPAYRHGYHNDHFRYFKRGHYYPGQNYKHNNDEFHHKINNDKYIPFKYDHNKQENERYTDFSHQNGYYRRNIVHAANVQDADLANISFRPTVQLINDKVDIDVKKNAHVLAKRDLRSQSQKVIFYGPNGINITGENVAEVMSPVETSKMVQVKIEEPKGEEISLNKDAENKLVEAPKETVSEKSEKIEVQKEVKPIIPKLAYYPSIYGPAYRHGYHHDHFRYYKRGNYNHGQDYKFNNAEFHQKLNNDKYIPFKYDYNKQKHERYTDFSHHNGNYKRNVVHAANVQDADLANISFRPTVQLIKPVETSKMVEVKIEEQEGEDISLNKDAAIKLVEATKETVSEKPEKIEVQKEVKPIVPKLVYGSSIYGPAYRHGYHHDQSRYYKRGHDYPGQDYKHNNDEFYLKLNNDKYIPLKYDNNKQENERYTDFYRGNGYYKGNIVHAANVQDADLANISFRPTVQPINDNVDIDIKKNAHVLTKRDVRRQSQKVNFYGPNGINITGETVAEAMPTVETSKMVEVKIEEQKGEEISLSKDAEIKLVEATKETVSEKPEKIEVQKVVKPIIPKLTYDSSIYGPAYRHGYQHDHFRYYKRGHYYAGQNYKHNNDEFQYKFNNDKYIPFKYDHNKQENERYIDLSHQNGYYRRNIVHAANVQDADLANISFRPTVQLIKPVETSKMVEVKIEKQEGEDISLNKDAAIKLVEASKETVSEKPDKIEVQKEVKPIVPKLAYDSSIYGPAYRHGYHHDHFRYYKRGHDYPGQDYKYNNDEFYLKLNNGKYIPLKYDHNKQENERYTDFYHRNGYFKGNIVHAANVQDADLANISFRPTVQPINDNVDIDIKKNAHVLAKRDVRSQLQKVNFYGPNGINITGESVAEAMPPVETSKMVEVKIEEQGGKDISLNKDAAIKLVEATKETVSEKPEKIEVQKEVKPIIPKLAYYPSIYGPAYRHGYHQDHFRYYKRGYYNHGPDYKYNNAEFHQKLNNDKYIPLKYDHNKQEHELYTDFSHQNGQYKLNVVHVANVQGADLANIVFRPAVQLINDHIDIDIKKNIHGLVKRDVQKISETNHFDKPTDKKITGESVVEVIPPVETSKLIEVKVEEQKDEAIDLKNVEMIELTKETVTETSKGIIIQKEEKPTIPKLSYDSSKYKNGYEHSDYFDNKYKFDHDGHHGYDQQYHGLFKRDVNHVSEVDPADMEFKSKEEPINEDKEVRSLFDIETKSIAYDSPKVKNEPELTEIQQDDAGRQKLENKIIAHDGQHDNNEKEHREIQQDEPEGRKIENKTIAHDEEQDKSELETKNQIERAGQDQHENNRDDERKQENVNDNSEDKHDSIESKQGNDGTHKAHEENNVNQYQRDSENDEHREENNIQNDGQAHATIEMNVNDSKNSNGHEHQDVATEGNEDQKYISNKEENDNANDKHDEIEEGLRS